MTMNFATGLDIEGSTAALSLRFASVNPSAIAWGSTIGRFGGGGVICTDDDKYLEIATTTETTQILSFAFYRTAQFGGNDRIWSLATSSSIGSIQFISNGANSVITAQRGGAGLGNFTITPEIWHWVSIKIFVANSNGTCDVEVDGTNVFSFSGDTQNGGDGVPASWNIGASIGNDMTYDDIIACDDQGSAPFNDLLEDMRIDTIMPDGAGDDSDWTPVSGANWTNVDEIPNDGDTTYVESAVAADSDLYEMEDTPPDVGSTIHGVQVSAVAKNPDGGTTDIAVKVKVDTTEDVGATQTLASDYFYISSFFDEDPDAAAAWTASAIDDMQAGMDVV